MEKMESLGDSLAQYRNIMNSYPESARHLPDDGICSKCALIVRNNPAVEKLLAIRGLKYYDDKENKVINKGVPYCRCNVIADEEKRTNASNYLLNVRSAGLPSSVKGPTPREFVAGTFANFNGRPGTEDALEMALDFTVGNSPPVLVFVGPPGSGKTHLLEAIGRQFLGQGRTVRYELVAYLLQRLRSSYNINEESSVMEVCYGADVLLLDDLGLEKPSDWVREQITSLVDERWRNNRLLVVGTNESHTTIEERLGPRLSSRLFDRSSGKVKVVYLVTGDYRAR
jgi:DNA replication protein DnaC